MQAALATPQSRGRPPTAADLPSRPVCPVLSVSPTSVLGASLGARPRRQVRATGSGSIHRHHTSGDVSVAVTEARGPLGPRHRWSLWTVGRWPRLYPRFLGGATPWEPPCVGVTAGSGPSTRGLHAAAGHRSRGRPGRNTCVRTSAEGLCGGKWMVVCVPPVRRGCRCGRAPRAPRSLGYILPLRGPGGPGATRASGLCSWDRPDGLATWLILPVVICLSQRLSHACLSISNYTVKLRMAH